MKKFIAILFAALMVLSLTAAAYAEFNVTGDARVRGIAQQNYDFDSDTDADNKYWDQRLRFRFDGKNEAGAAVKAQITVAEAQWNGTNETQADDDDIRLDDDDYAYISVPVAISGQTINVDAGFQPANWGLKWFSWGSADRLKLTTKVADWTVGVILQKDAETNDTLVGDPNGNDSDSTAVLAVGKIADFKVGAIYIAQKDARPADAGDCDSPGCPAGSMGKDASGNKGSIFFAGKAGPVNLAGEYAWKNGEVNETTDIDGDTNNPAGFFIHADMDAGPVNVAVAFANTKNGYTATKYFAPTLFFGKSQPTAMLNVGDSPAGGTDDTQVIVVGVKYPINESLAIGAKYANAKMKEYSAPGHGDEDLTVVEIDANLSYKIGANTTYSIDYGQLDLDCDSCDLDKASAMMHSLQVSF